MKIATNSSVLMCRRSGGKAEYFSGSDVRTGQPSEASSLEEIRHLQGKSEQKPPRPSYDASVYAVAWAVRGTRSPIGRLQIESACSLCKVRRTTDKSRAMCEGTWKVAQEAQMRLIRSFLSILREIWDREEAMHEFSHY